MRTLLDDVKDKLQFERDQLQEKLGTLEFERGTLQDTLADEQKWAIHPAAREQLEAVSGKIAGVRGEIDMKEQGIAIAENAKQVLAQQDEGPRQAGQGSEMPANATVEAFQGRTETGEVWKQAAEHVVKVEAPIAMTVALQDPQPQVFSADHPPTVDLGIALAMSAAAGREIYKTLKEQGENRSEADQAQAQALQSQQLEEMKGLKDDLKYQQQASQTQLKELGLDAKGNEESCKNEFNASVQKMNEMFATHDQERADLGIKNDELARDMQNHRSEMSGDLCKAEAERQVTAENDALVQSYGEKRTPDPALLKTYRDYLDTTAAQEIAARTETLQEQNFPQVSREGPSMGSPGGSAPSLPGGSSGPDVGSGPDRNDM